MKPFFPASNEADIYSQTHTHMKNKPILQNGALLLGFLGLTSHSRLTVVMQCAQVCPGADRLIHAHVPHRSYPGPEHSTATGSGQPSYCTLPLFHPLRRPEEPVHGCGYISNDGHSFNCRSPAATLQTFHV
jgi:hypothetical protein